LNNVPSKAYENNSKKEMPKCAKGIELEIAQAR
jgi:hypothetical protein